MKKHEDNPLLYMLGPAIMMRQRNHERIQKAVRKANRKPKYKGQRSAYLKGAHRDAGEAPQGETRQQRRARQRTDRKVVALELREKARQERTKEIHPEWLSDA